MTAGLACKGNPTALNFLFAEGQLRSPIWASVVRQKEAFLARSHVKAFLGFADDQLKRMTGGKGGGKKGQRPELEANYGYDVKAAMHVFRLLHECMELVSAGRITLPRPERDFLIRVRTGKYTVDKVLQMSKRLFAECEAAAASSSLPEQIDRRTVSEVLADCYQCA